jgi:hypothetical protein
LAQQVKKSFFGVANTMIFGVAKYISAPFFSTVNDIITKTLSCWGTAHSIPYWAIHAHAQYPYPYFA